MHGGSKHGGARHAGSLRCYAGRVVLLLSTYDLGRQPFGLASPAAWLRRAGFEAVALDLSRQTLDAGLVARARMVAISLPMHTATRLALTALDRVRALNPGATLCAYGLYAPLNEDLLRSHGVTHVLGPEFEADLLAVAQQLAAPGHPSDAAPVAPEAARPRSPAGHMTLPRLPFIQPDRRGLPAPASYATLQLPDGTRRVAGSTDATRGCKHWCRHCPIVPVYRGQVRVVPVDVVLADIRAQVAAGVEHVTFADPDFLNGPAHARRIVEALHAEWPALTFDATIKIEHLLKHRELLPVLAAHGCLFVTSAVESIDDDVLRLLRKGHTRADFEEAVRLCRTTPLTLAPTFVAFTPWTTLPGYRALLDAVEDLGLVAHVSPVQWAIRLLVTLRSPLLELSDVRAVVSHVDPRTLTHPWRHPDARVDALQRAVMQLVGVQINRPRQETFDAIRALADAAAGGDDRRGGERVAARRLRALPSRATIPYLNEPWYC
ncbi:MAG: radical SAM protein [Acidobacteria bacterium]|nr:radical SAM protein [Acidobacteriota bacterium]